MIALSVFMSSYAFTYCVLDFVDKVIDNEKRRRWLKQEARKWVTE